MQEPVPSGDPKRLHRSFAGQPAILGQWLDGPPGPGA